MKLNITIVSSVLLAFSWLYSPASAYAIRTDTDLDISFPKLSTNASLLPVIPSQNESNQNQNVYFLTPSESEEVKRLLGRISELEEQGDYARMIPFLEELYPIATKMGPYDPPSIESVVGIFLVWCYYSEYEDTTQIPSYVRDIERTRTVASLLNENETPSQALERISDDPGSVSRMKSNGRENSFFSSVLAGNLIRFYLTLSDFYNPMHEHWGDDVKSDMVQTERLLQLAVDIGNTHLDSSFTIPATESLALLRREQGDIPGYLEGTEKVARDMEEGPPNPLLSESQTNLLAESYLTMAVSSVDIGDFDKAQKVLDSIPPVEEQSGFFPYYKTRIQLVQAFLYISAEQYPQAIEYIESLLPTISDTETTRLETFYSVLAVAYLHEGNTKRAESVLDEARGKLGHLSVADLDSSFSLALAIRAFDEKNYQESKKYLDSILPFSDVSAEWLFGYRDTARMYSFLGIVDRLAGDSESATSNFRNSLDTVGALSKYTLYYGSEIQKVRYVDTLSRVLNPIVSSQLNEPNQDIDQLAFSALLESKGRVLDFFSNGYTVLRQQSDSKTIDIINKIENVRSQLSNLAFSTSTELYSGSLLMEMSQLQSQLSELESEASRRVSLIDDDITTANPGSVAEQIPDDAVLIEFLIYRPVIKDSQFSEMFGEPRYAAYLMQHNGNIIGIDLGAVAEIEPLVADMQRAVRNPGYDIGQVKETAQALDARVMEPIRQRLGNAKHLLLSPDGALNLIPFEALVDRQGEYLVENYTLTYLTSGRDLLRLQETASHQTEPVLLANPIFEQPGNIRSTAVAQSSTQPPTRYANLKEQNWGVLENSGEEANRIAANFPKVQNLQGADATEAALNQVNRPSFLHIATHGFFEPTNSSEVVPIDNPLLRSGLVLSGVNAGQSGTKEDGIVSALEVSSLNLLGTQLVVLSACDTGLGDLSIGEGVYGLRRALVLAGSQSQLISLWRVRDDTTRDLMVKYYEHLLLGMGRSESLRQTQLAMLENEATAHPYYWAAFINSGDWRPILE